MEKYRPFLFLGAALIIALITSVMAYNWLQKKTAAKETSLEIEPVAVAITDLSQGTVLTKDMIKQVSFLKGSLPKDEYFPDPSPLQGRVLILPVKANEPILKSRLAPDSITSGGVAAVVDPKKRAMAVRVDKVIGVSGFIHPGNRVDVLVTLSKSGKDSGPITKIVLQNIPILAVGTEYERRGKSEKPIQVDVITLEVTPEEAEKLALSTTEGRIQLALRSYNNIEEVSTAGATIPALLTGRNVRSGPKVARVGVKQKVSVEATVRNINVEVLRGSKKSTETFKGEMD